MCRKQTSPHPVLRNKLNVENYPCNKWKICLTSVSVVLHAWMNYEIGLLSLCCVCVCVVVVMSLALRWSGWCVPSMMWLPEQHCDDRYVDALPASTALVHSATNSFSDAFSCQSTDELTALSGAPWLELNLSLTSRNTITVIIIKLFIGIVSQL